MRFFSVPPLPAKICHLNRSLEYAEKTACCLLTIAQFGTYYLADHRALVPARRVSRRTGT